MLRARSFLRSLAGRSALALVAVAASAGPALADTKTWTGAAGSDWSTAGNWAGGVPAAGDTVVFPVTAANRTNNNDLPAGTPLGNITFLGSGYVLGGNTLDLAGAIVNGLSPNNCGLDNRVAAAISLSGPLSTRGCWGQLRLAGAIDLGTHTLTLEDNQVTILDGVVSGTGSIHKTSGTITGGYPAVFSGANTYTGATTQSAGGLEINGVQPSSDVTVSGAYWMRTAGTGAIGALTTGSEVWPGAQDGTLTGRLGTGDLVLGDGSRLSIDITGAFPLHDQLAVTGAVTLAATAGLTANLANFAPATGQQFVIVDNDGADVVSGTFNGLPEGGTLTAGVVEFSVSYVGGDGNDVVLTCTSSQNTWTGAVDGSWSDPGNWTGGVPAIGAPLLFPETGANRTMTNDLPPGTTIGAITFTGGNYTIGGSLDLGGAIVNGAYPNNCGLSNRIDAAMTLQAPVVTRGCWGQLLLTGTIDLGAHQLTLEDTQHTQVSGVVSGTGSIRTTVGTPSFGSVAILSGDNTYTGATTQNAFALEVYGSQPASAVTVSGQFWYRTSGTGTIGALTTSSDIWPGTHYGNTPGRLGTGDLTMEPGSRLTVDLNGALPGTGHDQVSVTGAVTLNADVSLTANVSSFTPTIGQQFVIVANDGTDAIAGTFAGLPEGAAFTSSAMEFTISYAGGDGNDVVLTCTTAPNTWTGAVDASWSEAGNWTAGVPVAGDSILFPVNASNRANTNDLPAGTALANITFLAGGYTIGGNRLRLSGTVANGVYSNNCGFTNEIAAPITLDAPITTRGCWGQLLLTGAIDLGAHQLKVEDGQVTVVSGVVSGTGSIVALSSPPIAGYPLVLSGNNTYTGATTQSAYFVEVHGSQPSSALTASNGTPWMRTAGRGTVGALTTDGEIWPGTYDSNTTGSLGTGLLTMGSGSKLTLDLNGPIPGTGYDQLRVTGTANLSPNVALGASLAFTPARGQVFVVIENDGADAVAGTFTGLAEGAMFDVGPYPFQISYLGKTGNDVTLTSLSGDPLNAAPVALEDAWDASTAVALVVAAPGVLDNDSDPDGNTLTVVQWPATSSQGGTITGSEDGSFTYTSAAGFEGTDTFTYVISDGNNATDSATVTITVVQANRAPVGVADAYTTGEDTTLAVPAPGVLANDTDADADTLTATLVSGPAQGALALNADGSFTYAPTANWNGVDSFTYTAGDGTADSAVVTVAIDVTAANDPPDAVDDAHAVLEGMRLSVAAPGLLANDVDPESDALSTTLVSGPASGVLTLGANGAFDYDANPGFRGADSFVYRATDGSGAFDDATVSLTVTASADLRVSITDTPDPQRPGAGVTYTVMVTNDGPSRAAAVTLVDTLPAGARLASRPTSSQGACSIGAGVVTCELGPLAAGASATLSLVVTADGPGTITNSAAVSGTDPDPAAGNDSDQESTAIGVAFATPRPLIKRTEFGAGMDTGTAPLTLQNDAPVPFDYVLHELAAPATAEGGTAGGFDVPWLALSPVAGTVPAMSTEDVTATFDAAGLPPARYRAAVGVDGSPFAIDDVPVCFTVGFQDVPAGAFAESHIHALAGASVTGGCSASTFCPAQLLPRGVMAVWLLRAKEGPAYVPPPATGTVFLDVPVTHFAAAYIEELQRRGVTNGCGSGNFCPVHPVTRSSMAVFLLKTLEGLAYVPPPATGVFADVPVSSAFAPWVEEIARRNITSGCGGGNYCPDHEIARAQSAVLTVATFALPMCGQ